MNRKTRKPEAFYVAHGERFSYVRGRDAAIAKLAEYLGESADYVRANRRKVAGLIKRVTEAEAKAANI